MSAADPRRQAGPRARRRGPGSPARACLLLALLAGPMTAAPQEAPPTPATEGKAPPAGQQAKAEKPPSARQRRRAADLYLRAARHLDVGELRSAYGELEEAAGLDPGNRDYALAVEIARQHLVTRLVEEAGRARLLGHGEQARVLLADAAHLDPRNPVVTQHLYELEATPPARLPALAIEPAADMAPPVELEATRGRATVHLLLPRRDLITRVLAEYGLQATFDDSVHREMTRIDFDGLNLEQGLHALRLVTNTILVPLDPRRVLVAVDSKQNRDQYERLAMETVYLPGLNPTELTDMTNILHNVFDVQQATAQPEKSTLTLRAPASSLPAVNRTLAHLIDGKDQVVLDVRLLEVDRTRSRNIGVQLPSQYGVFNVPTELNQIIQNNPDLVQQIISAGLAQPGDYAAIVAILLASGAVSGSILSQPFALFGGGITTSGLTLGTTNVNLALNSSDARAIDQIELRLGDLESGTIRAGTRYPIVTSSFSSLAGTSGVNIPGITNAGSSSALAGLGINLSGLGTQQTIPQVQYEDLGLTLKATPHVLRSGEVSLKLELKVEALAGGVLDGNPILNSRQMENTITLPAGESALVMSDLSRQESRAVTGIAGASELPGLGLPTNKSVEYDYSTLTVVITPYVVRRAHTHADEQMVLLPQHR